MKSTLVDCWSSGMLVGYFLSFGRESQALYCMHGLDIHYFGLVGVMHVSFSFIAIISLKRMLFYRFC